jgi:ribosomal protein S6--L-glutamate ligase
LQILARDGVGLPVTAFANETSRTEEILKLVGGAPVVVKLLEGTQGIGVVLGETHKSAKSVIEAFRGADINILVQEFVAEADGRDIRAFIVGRKIVAAMERKGPEGEFRSNLHRGGSAVMVDLTTAEKTTALKAAQSMGLNVAGVDLLRSKRGPVVMEVNSSPGLEGIEAASTKDVAKAMIEFLEKNAKPGRTKTRGKG